MKDISVEKGKAKCHDCKKTLKEGEKCVPYETQGKTFFKCVKCYENDSVLRNYQDTEVYSRIVGYIRPTKQWNVGKSAEYQDRKEFVVQES